MPVSSSNVTVMLSGSPKPGEAIRAVLLGDLNLNLSTVEFQWYKKEYNQEYREPHRQPKKSDRLEELSDDEFEIHGGDVCRHRDVACFIKHAL